MFESSIPRLKYLSGVGSEKAERGWGILTNNASKGCRKWSYLYDGEDGLTALYLRIQDFVEKFMQKGTHLCAIGTEVKKVRSSHL